MHTHLGLLYLGKRESARYLIWKQVMTLFAYFFIFVIIHSLSVLVYFSVSLSACFSTSVFPTCFFSERRRRYESKGNWGCVMSSSVILWTTHTRTHTERVKSTCVCVCECVSLRRRRHDTPSDRCRRGRRDFIWL